MSRITRIPVLMLATLVPASVAFSAARLPDEPSNRYQLSVYENVMYVVDTTTGQCWSKHVSVKTWKDHGSPLGVVEVAPEPEVSQEPLSLKLPKELVTMTLRQRGRKTIPGSAGRIRIQLDDITGGQVILSISAGKDLLNPYPDQMLLEEQSVKPGDIVSFMVNDVEYFVRLKELTNVLIGTDIAVLEVASSREAFPKDEREPSKAERERKDDDDKQAESDGDGER